MGPPTQLRGITRFVRAFGFAGRGERERGKGGIVAAREASMRAWKAIACLLLCSFAPEDDDPGVGHRVWAGSNKGAGVRPGTRIGMARADRRFEALAIFSG